MVKVNVQPDCSNAPKAILLRDFTIAIPINDLPIIFNYVTDEIEWKWVIAGKETVVGKSAIENTFREMFDTSIEEMTITDIDIYGVDEEVGLTEGIITRSDGKIYSFANVCLFASGDESVKIKEILSFLTEGQLDGPNSWGQFPSHTRF